MDRWLDGHMVKQEGRMTERERECCPGSPTAWWWVVKRRGKQFLEQMSEKK